MFLDSFGCFLIAWWFENEMKESLSFKSNKADSDPATCKTGVQRMDVFILLPPLMSELSARFTVKG